MGNEAHSLYTSKQEQVVTAPDSVTFTSLLQACAEYRSSSSRKAASCTDCGTRIARNVMTWSAMIAGYAEQGMSQEALTLFRSMQQAGITPNSSTFVCLLQAYLKFCGDSKIIVN